jgi:multisubunit Na+/H+ antiporter MnhF subunit
VIRRLRPQRLEPDRRTLALAVVAGGAVLAVMAGELGRVWHRGSAPLPGETDDVLTAVEDAVVETAQVAKAGYQEVSGRENAMFNLLTSFVGTFLTARFVTFRLRRRQRVGPFRDFQLGRRRIHHFVPGIVLAFAAGGAAIVTRNEDIEPMLAVPFGIGLGLTLDESALLLDLEDVYWTREGLLSVQITLAVISLLAALALGLRFLRRGEELVLEGDDGADGRPG